MGAFPIYEQFPVPLHERLAHLAEQLYERARKTNDSMLSDDAYSIASFAREVETEYARLPDAHSNGVTVAQSVALGRVMGKARSMGVARGGAGLPDDYLYVRLDDGYEGGIDREGRTST